MSEETGNGDSDGSGGAIGVPSDGAALNWEERLAAARSEREKVLKANGKPLKKKVIPRPQFMDEDPAANWTLADRPPEEIPDVATPAEYAAAARQKSQPPEPFPSELSEPLAALPTQAVGKAPSVSAAWVVIVAFACFFGLGAGMVLSFGAVVGMGWVSIGEITSKEIAADASPSEVAPEAQLVVFKPLAPVQAALDPLPWRSSALTPVRTSLANAPVLYPALQADNVLPKISSPAPRFDGAGLTNTPVTRLDFQPARISVSFATPQKIKSLPAPLDKLSGDADSPPYLLEKSNIRPLTVLAAMNEPQFTNAVVKIASVDAMPLPRAPQQTLFQSGPGIVPEITWARLARPEVFDDGMVRMTVSLPGDLDGVIRSALVDKAPLTQLPVRPQTLKDQQAVLPQIGGAHDYVPSLAFELGMSGAAAQRINLVTFAPSDVTDKRLRDNAERLAATGFPISKTNRVNFKVSKTHIRYYWPQDAALAQALADEVGGRARSFTNSRNRPPAGQVEIWLQGNRKGTQSVATQRQTVNAAQKRATFRSQLENRLADKLRRGEHLGSTSR